MMTSEQIAARWKELVTAEKDMDALKELYADGIISVESAPADPRETKGMDAKLEKMRQWEEEMVEELHSFSLSDPIITPKHIVFRMDMDITMKGEERTRMPEIVLLTVEDGKIVKEEYLY